MQHYRCLEFAPNVMLAFEKIGPFFGGKSWHSLAMEVAALLAAVNVVIPKLKLIGLYLCYHHT